MSDMHVDGIVNDIDADYYLQGARLTRSHGSADITMQWQIYSSIQKLVLAKINNKDCFESKTNNASGKEALVVGRSRKTCVG